MVLRNCVIGIIISICFVQWGMCDDLPEHVYVISLDRTPERLKFVKEQLDREGLPCTHFHAIDGKFCISTDVETNEQVSQLKNDRIYLVEDSKNRNNKAKFVYVTNKRNWLLIPGEYGCTMSHRGVWLDIVEHGYTSAIVFEDDVQFSSNFKENLKNLIRNLPEDCDILFLDIMKLFYDVKKHREYSTEFFISNFHNTKSPYYAKITKAADLYGLHSYYITLNVAKKLLAYSKMISMPIDNHVLYRCDCLNMYVSKIKLLQAGVFDSIIDSSSNEFKRGREKLD